MKPPGCDFCAVGVVPVWSYPCEDFLMGTSSAGVHVSTGAWLACGPCADLIEADKWEALVERSIDRYLAVHPEFRGQRPAIAARVRPLHQMFRRHRLDQPRELL